MAQAFGKAPQTDAAGRGGSPEARAHAVRVLKLTLVLLTAAAGLTLFQLLSVS